MTLAQIVEHLAVAHKIASEMHEETLAIQINGLILELYPRVVEEARTAIIKITPEDAQRITQDPAADLKTPPKTEVDFPERHDDESGENPFG